MKKLGTVALILFYSFILTAQVNIVSAVEASVNLCPGGQFQGLCDLRAGNVGTIIGSVITILLILAVVLAIIFLIWGGIRWVMSGGDKAAVESARSTIIAALVGLIIAFAAYFLISLALNLFGLSDTGTFTFPTLLGDRSGPPCGPGDPGYPRC